MNSPLEKIRVERPHRGQVARIIFSSPKGNVLDSRMMGELSSILDDIGSSPEVKAIVFEGEGEHYSFGASIEEHVREKVAGMLQKFHAIFRRLNDLGLPTLSLVRGQCLGGGMEIALFSSIVVAERSAKFGQPEIRLGVFPPIAALLLGLRIGQAKAEQICLTGRVLKADEALEMGMVDFLVEDGRGQEFLDQWLEKNILPHSASSLRLTLKACRRSVSRLLDEELPRIESLYLDELMSTDDGNEGIASYMQKRQPAWKNR